MKITLEADEVGDGSTWKALHSGVADNNGRVPGTEFPKIEAGRNYRMTFDTKAYFEQEGVTDYFFPVVRIEFRTKNAVRASCKGARATLTRVRTGTLPHSLAVEPVWLQHVSRKLSICNKCRV
jgi:hypothetical protein